VNTNNATPVQDNTGRTTVAAIPLRCIFQGTVYPLVRHARQIPESEDSQLDESTGDVIIAHKGIHDFPRGAMIADGRPAKVRTMTNAIQSTNENSQAHMMMEYSSKVIIHLEAPNLVHIQ
jgi:hypothetical protein